MVLGQHFDPSPHLNLALGTMINDVDTPLTFCRIGRLWMAYRSNQSGGLQLPFAKGPQLSDCGGSCEWSGHHLRCGVLRR